MTLVSIEAVLWTLTVLAALVVVLTRVRVLRESSDGPARVGPLVLGLHTGLGLLAVLTWGIFLAWGENAPLGSAGMGIVALALWWLTSLAGLLIGMRWKPSSGRHSGPSRYGSWGEWCAGPGLSLLAHVGLVVIVAVFTWAYLTAAV